MSCTLYVREVFKLLFWFIFQCRTCTFAFLLNKVICSLGGAVAKGFFIIIIITLRGL